MNHIRSPILVAFRSRSTIVVSLFAGLIAILSLIIATVPAQADHNSMDIICPDPIPEGEHDWIRYRRDGYNIRWAYAFTYPAGTHQAGRDDYGSYDRHRFEGRAGENSLYIPAVTFQDDRPEYNETFSLGAYFGEEWHGCEIKIIDDDVPEVANIEITSMPTISYYYLAGDAIDVTLTFNEPVETDADTLLSIYVGNEGESTWRGARYHHGSGTQHLTFRYRVQTADMDLNGISVSTAGMDIDRIPTHGFSGSITVKGTDVPVNYNHGGISTASQHVIDGRPIAIRTGIISSPEEPWGAYRANQTIEFAFTYNIDVEVEGRPTVAIGIGWDGENGEEALREAEYLRGSGTDTLVFGYTVTPGDNDRKGVTLFLGHPEFGYGGDGTINAEGTDIERNPNYLGKSHFEAHKVDTVPPTIDAVSVVSTPENGEAYDIGETVVLNVEFSEKVLITGDPYISVDVGGVDRHATLPSVAPDSFVDSAVFQYQVQEGDNDDDGIGLFANSLYLNSGGIHDKAGIGLGLTHAAIAADPNQKVDTPAKTDSSATN